MKLAQRLGVVLFSLSMIVLISSCNNIELRPELKAELRGVSTIRMGQATGFATYIFDAIDNFGTASYLWDGDGVTKDLYYQGSLIATPYAPNVCHCVGTTLQIYFTAFQSYVAEKNADGMINNLSVEDMKYFKRLWFVATDRLEGAQAALTDYGLGQAVNLDSAEPGDFVQLWRNSGSGHGVVFDSWERDQNGTISGIRYFSCNSDGPGYQLEKVGTASGDVNINRIHIARAHYPQLSGVTIHDGGVVSDLALDSTIVRDAPFSDFSDPYPPVNQDASSGCTIGAEGFSLYPLSIILALMIVRFRRSWNR